MRQLRFTFVALCLVLSLIKTSWGNPVPKLGATHIANYVKTHPQWQHRQNQLTRTFTFKTGFKGAVDFIQELVEPADRLGHHPDLKVSYNRVHITLTTHDAGGLTTLDLKLASIINKIYNRIHVIDTTPSREH